MPLAAVRCACFLLLLLAGGGDNHRMGLYDMMMIKDNHVTAAGGVSAAIQAAEKFIQEQVWGRLALWGGDGASARRRTR